MKHTKRRSGCPISFALDILGDKWTLLVVRDLLLRDKVYYGDFLKSEEHIATNILADRLQMLEHVGIITKVKDPRAGNKIIYSLTQKGIDLLPILVEIVLWSSKYDPITGASKEFVEKARNDKKGLMKAIKANFENKISRKLKEKL